MAAIEVENVSKVFRRHTGRKLIRERIVDLFRPGAPEHLFYAVRNVSFTIAEGESVALVGSNGAGKSTLLSIIAGLCRPNEGTVRVQGRIAALLELGSGFHPDLTGNENVALNGALMGLSKRELNAQIGGIADFAELEEFMDAPIRTYSSGMVARLAFSIAVHVNPAIMIIDEVLSVGDTHFSDKCVQKLAEMTRQGKTLLCVSHSAATVRQFCDRSVWLHHGRMMMDGPTEQVLQAYTEQTAAVDAR
jgi:ABC-type polysaccharide/polyol phosphate transport system ATPase subunit